MTTIKEEDGKVFLVEEESKYNFSFNISVQELKDILNYAEQRGDDVVGLHILRDSIIDAIYVSGWGPEWEDIENHIDVTDYSNP